MFEMPEWDAALLSQAESVNVNASDPAGTGGNGLR